jgi:hypothetical protein
MKIFRKLRVKSISENKTIKYLKYALGEVVLLVIVIFIAVQLNNANETRKLNQVEIDILKGIERTRISLMNFTDLGLLKYSNSF